MLLCFASLLNLKPLQTKRFTCMHSLGNVHPQLPDVKRFASLWGVPRIPDGTLRNVSGCVRTRTSMEVPVASIRQYRMKCLSHCELS